MTEDNKMLDNEEVEDYSSELKILLDNLADMFECYLSMSSRKAGEVLLRAFTMEVAMITLKLKALRKRWWVYLPFKEVIDVRFSEYEKLARMWLNLLTGQDESVEDEEYVLDYLHLDNDYLLDMMDYDIEPIRPGLKPDELNQAVVTYCKKVDKLLKKSQLDDWEEKAMNRIEPKVLALVEQATEEDNLKEVCATTIRQFAKELTDLEDYFSSDLGEERFMVLANRLMHRDCQKAIKEAHDTVRKEHNSWPKKFEKDRAIAMKERVKMKLFTEAHGNELKDYIDLDYPELLEDACFGQYLFRERHRLSYEDVALMVHYCTMIGDLNQYIDPTLAIKKRKAQALGRELTAEEKSIVKTLLGFADKAEWRNNATADSIKLGINRMLGVGFHLEPDMQRHSDSLWRLLKGRRNKTAEESLMLTWFNIVGYCVRKDLLTGGSPALAKLFYPRCHEDDYKAIIKGKNGDNATFKGLEPLLDKYLK